MAQADHLRLVLTAITQPTFFVLQKRGFKFYITQNLNLMPVSYCKPILNSGTSGTLVQMGERSNFASFANWMLLSKYNFNRHLFSAIAHIIWHVFLSINVIDMTKQISMQQLEPKDIQEQYFSFIDNKTFACVAAKAALAKSQIQCFIAENMACPKDDYDILQFLYKSIDKYRSSDELYHSAVVIFQGPEFVDEEMFERLLWKRLQSLSTLDAANFKYDNRVDDNPASPDFSFSLKEESFFIIGLHPASSRPSRRFSYPALVFNPHQQFEQLRASGKYDNLKHVVRKRDIALAGSVNPMLTDFGRASEVYQYSGRNYADDWQCPLKINHPTN